MNPNRRTVSACITVVVFFAAATLFATDTLLIHGHIYTGNAKAPWAQALAITGTRIDAVGTDPEILARKSAKTEVIDLQGRTVVPGFSDDHTHMWFGALELHGLNLSTPEASVVPEDDPEGVVSRIKAFAGSHPNDKLYSSGLTTAPLRRQRLRTSCWTALSPTGPSLYITRRNTRSG